jgi:uncharacterized protein YkwD
MVRNHRSRTRAGAAAAVAALVAGLTVGVAGTTQSAEAMLMKSDRTATSGWVKKYNKRLTYLINKRRVEHGLHAVPRATCVDGYAKRWSSHMVSRDSFSHSNLGNLLSDCHATYASENIAMVYDGAHPRDLVRAWMDSPDHRANILSRHNQFTGVSVRWNPQANAWVAVQNFMHK